jgi:hypothetical protein
LTANYSTIRYGITNLAISTAGVILRQIPDMTRSFHNNLASIERLSYTRAILRKQPLLAVFAKPRRCGPASIIVVVDKEVLIVVHFVVGLLAYPTVKAVAYLISTRLRRLLLLLTQLVLRGREAPLTQWEWHHAHVGSSRGNIQAHSHW